VKRLLELFNGGVSMTEPLRDKLIRCGWVTNFNADTLVRLIERHYAALEAQPEPVGPTDEDLYQLWMDLYAFPDGPTSLELAYIARAVLQRWGRPICCIPPVGHDRHAA